MTAVDLVRLENFLEAQQSLGGDAIAIEDTSLIVAMGHMQPWRDLAICACKNLNASPSVKTLEAWLTHAFLIGQQWERAEQMRREFGDAEVQR